MPIKYLCLTLLIIAVPLQGAPKLEYELIAENTHDSATFTQGLEIDGEQLLESSGIYGSSYLRRYNIANNEIVKEISLPKSQFAEGLTLVDNRIYLLTWREQILYVLDKSTLKPLFKLTYEGEGWGLTYDGSHLIMSDGSDKLFYRNKKNFEVKRVLEIKDKGAAVKNLNELEYAWHFIWANVWRENRILQIDPLSGNVMGEIDLTDLAKKNNGNFRNVLNGIAHDKKTDALWVTGKYWPNRYLIKVKPRNN